MTRKVTFLTPGRNLSYRNGTGADINAGDVVFIGDVCGVAAVNIANGDVGTVYISGVCRFPAKSDDVVAVGDDLYWDSANSRATLTQTDHLIGVAVTASANGITVVNALLNLAVAAAQLASTTKAGAVELATLGETAERSGAPVVSAENLPAFLYPASASDIVDAYGKNGDIAFLYEAGHTVAIYEKASGHWAVKVASQAFALPTP